MKKNILLVSLLIVIAISVIPVYQFAVKMYDNYMIDSKFKNPDSIETLVQEPGWYILFGGKDTRLMKIASNGNQKLFEITWNYVYYDASTITDINVLNNELLITYNDQSIINVKTEDQISNIVKYDDLIEFKQHSIVSADHNLIQITTDEIGYTMNGFNISVTNLLDLGTIEKIVYIK